MEHYDIVYLGNPALRMVSEQILETEFGTQELDQLTNKLFHALQAEQGLGLAAPQIGIKKRAIVFGLASNPRLPEIPFTVLFNPSFEPLNDECVEDYEGCISVGKLRAKVSRYKSILYRGYDVKGKLIEQEVHDLHARVFQHELDHLDGIIFLDRVTNHASLGFHDELVKHGILKLRHTE